MFTKPALSGRSYVQFHLFLSIIMNSQPHEQLPEPPFRVPSQQPKPRALSIFNPGPDAIFNPGPDGVPSSNQPNQSSTGAAPGNDNTIDGAPGQIRNGGGKVCNIKTYIWIAKADIAYPADLGPIRIVSRILPTKTLDDMVSAYTDSPATQEN